MTNRFKLSSVNPSFVFLTLCPDQVPESSAFAIKNYLNLAEGFPVFDSAQNLAHRLLHDWLELVSRFYAKQEVKLDDILSYKLQDDEGLDGGYLYFKKAISLLDLPAHLEFTDCWRASEQGRRYYGVLISKPTWRPAEIVEVEGVWNLPHNAFNIHFEPQYTVLNEIFKVFLHYEVNPYYTEVWVRKNIPENQYNAYLSQTHLLQSKASC